MVWSLKSCGKAVLLFSALCYSNFCLLLRLWAFPMLSLSHPVTLNHNSLKNSFAVVGIIILIDIVFPDVWIAHGKFLLNLNAWQPKMVLISEQTSSLILLKVQNIFLRRIAYYLRLALHCLSSYYLLFIFGMSFHLILSPNRGQSPFACLCLYF